MSALVAATVNTVVRQTGCKPSHAGVLSRPDTDKYPASCHSRRGCVSVFAALTGTYLRPRPLALVRPDELGAAEVVLPDRALDLCPGRTLLELELAVEGMKAEEVSVRAVARRRARTAVARRAEVVFPLPGRRLGLSEPTRARVDSPGEPVGERAPRRIRVVADERERARPLGRVRPVQGRREILALARVSARDGGSVLEGGAPEIELTHASSLLFLSGWQRSRLRRRRRPPAAGASRCRARSARGRARAPR